MTEDPEHGLDRYLIEIRSHSQIPEDEDALIRSSRTGDQNARKILVQSYLALTAEIGLRLAPPKMRPAVQLGPAIQKHFAGFS